MILSYAYCNASLMPMRAEPSHKAEMVNQILYGEKVEVLEINEEEWAKVRCELDEYIGWCKVSQITIVTAKEYKKQAKHIALSNNNHFVFENSTQWVPMGSELFAVRGGKVNIQGKEGKYKGKRLSYEKMNPVPEQIIEAAKEYINAPYLWGGRSIAGIDCSGLVQMAFKMCGEAVPRDASQQAEIGEDVDFLQHARAADLAFFDNAEGRITHVGILIDDSHILHATDTSGRVVIDKIDQGGIISKILKRRTHKLRMIKRYL
ncbi:MAG: C40 family peptidase [Chitinophagales bacterium]|nr:C40 family peptidase [Chitinophagaceae bacterium]MCB9064484.1 C40 family peptidase [Chitinophagales bacterium]